LIGNSPLVILSNINQLNNMKKELHPVLGSSVDPTQLALTWKGVAVGVIPIIVIVAKQFNIVLDQNDLVAFVDSLLTVVSAVMVAWGLGRKIVVRFQK